MTSAIQIENLGKCYRLGETHEHTLSDQFVRLARRLTGRNAKQTAAPEDFWALRDVNLEIAQGEAVGIIGSNGAGKSTLLKILSRITQPTTGRAVVRGRLSSLLEVGTGFHPELTGRENVYLNGTILGMRKAEVTRKFDEIVDFAGIERFIDTPVKRYSSGMYVRLAFAVAAHLEPDVLVIDEVLAVGDAEFQKRCLGKIGEVASEGRTVLFVSHNMQAVSLICSKAVLFANGVIAEHGHPERVISSYLSTLGAASDSVWVGSPGLGNDFARLSRIQIYDEHDAISTTYRTDAQIFVELFVECQELNPALCVGFDLIKDNSVVFRTYNTDPPEKLRPQIAIGANTIRCRIPSGLLAAGVYQIAPRIGLHNQEWIVNTDPLVEFETYLQHGESAFWASLDHRSRPGVIAPILDWRASPIDTFKTKQ